MSEPITPPVPIATAKAGAILLSTLEDPVTMGTVATVLAAAIPGFGPLLGIAVGQGIPALVKWLDTVTGPVVTVEAARAAVAEMRKSSGPIDVAGALS